MLQKFKKLIQKKSAWIFFFSAFIFTFILLFAYFNHSEEVHAAKEPSKSFCEQNLSVEYCEKIGQMLIVGFGGLDQSPAGKILWEDPNNIKFIEDSNIARAIKDLHIGGVILFNRPYRNNANGEFIRERNIRNPTQTAALTQDLQNYSANERKNAKFKPLPLFISVDQEGGMVDRLPAELGFPLTTFIPQALGANEEQALQNANIFKEKNKERSKEKALKQTQNYANEMAEELQQAHFNLNFAPCVDININPLNPILGGRGRCFSSDPTIVTDQAEQFIKAFKAADIIATIKHFPGHGSSLKDTHVGLVDVTETYEMSKELLPYQQLIDQGFQDIVMTTHVINGQIDKSQCKKGNKNDPKTWCPGTMSQATLTELLRNKMKFNGVIISDDMTMGAIAEEYPLDVALEKAIHAGVNMFIIANNYEDDTEKVVNAIVKLMVEKRISAAQIDASYQKIVELKKRIK